MSNNTEDKFHIGGRSYSKRELEEVAEHITRTDWRDHLPMVMRGPNGEETEITPSQDTIERIFNGVANSEENLHKRLVLTHYFLETERPLIPKMVSVLKAGIENFLDGGKAWTHGGRKSRSKELLLFMQAMLEKSESLNKKKRTRLPTTFTEDGKPIRRYEGESESDFAQRRKVNQSWIGKTKKEVGTAADLEERTASNYFNDANELAISHPELLSVMVSMMPNEFDKAVKTLNDKDEIRRFVSKAAQRLDERLSQARSANTDAESGKITRE
ncbi:hypothetical protein [Aeromonas rivipollensis]|uniref:hypothetical protein n=1 Tax=Aeromonas rivipollensis TaxID=948519 RepID=UPI003D2224A2